MKRFLAILCAITLMVSNCLPVYAAANSPSLTVDTVTAEAGASVEVPIRISGNTGICGATFFVTYDEALTLTAITAGDAFSSLTMTKPGKLTLNPFKLVWDGIDNDTSNGVIAVLTFTAPAESGTYDVEVFYEDGDVLDSDINPVDVTITNGAVQVSGAQPPVEPEKPETNKPVVTVNTVTAEAGESVQIPIMVSGNTGICGATLSVAYDSALTLTDITKGDAFASLTMTKPGKLTANPFNLVWDGTDNDTTNGTIAILTFTAPEEAGTYAVNVSYKDGDVLDGNVQPVTLGIKNGTVEVKSAEEPPVEPPVVDNPKITVDSLEVISGGSVEVPIMISGNTGICGATFSVAYDEGLLLTDIKAGNALTSLTMTKPGDMSANPFNLVWDGTDNDTSNGTIVTLVFTAHEVGTYEVNVSYEDGDVLDGDIQPVTLDIENGKVTVVHKEVEDPCLKGHSYGSWYVIEDATCTATGIREHVCEKCGSTEQEAIPMAEHTEVTDDAVAPDCENTGLTEGIHCSVCSKVIKEQETVLALGHNYKDGICTNCGKVDETNPPEAAAPVKMTVSTVEAEAGATVEVPIVISENTGICGATISVSYDEGLVLTGIEKGEAFSSLAMTKPGNMAANPFKLVWDGTDNDTTNGEIAVLTFTAPEEAGEYEVKVSCEEGDVLDGNIQPVALEITNGVVIVAEKEQPPVDPEPPVEPPVVENPKLTVVSAETEAGKTVEVPIEISGNTGICGATLSVAYDEGLVLTGIERGNAFADLAMTKPGNMSANPFKLVWDGTDNDDSNGTIVVLVFTAPEEAGEYEVKVSYEDGDVLDGDIQPVTLDITNGVVKVEGEAADGLLGDVNGDNSIDTSDAQAIFNHFMGIAELPEDKLALADITGEGQIDTSDAQAAFNIFMGIM